AVHRFRGDDGLGRVEDDRGAPQIEHEGDGGHEDRQGDEQPARSAGHIRFSPRLPSESQNPRGATWSGPRSSATSKAVETEGSPWYARAPTWRIPPCALDRIVRLLLFHSPAGSSLW